MLNFDWLAGVSIGTAKWIFLILFIVIGILVSLLPKSYIYEGVENPRWWHNLKLWAWGVLGLIFFTYYIF
jgi:hypothetical protein